MTISRTSHSTNRTATCLLSPRTTEKLDPNVWFNNVERVAAARVGQETVRYARNICKYYVAYKLIEEADADAAAIVAAATGPATAGTSAPSQPAKPR